MSSVSILPILSKKKLNGDVPLYLRIIRKRIPRYISLQICINPKHWDNKRQRVTSYHPNSGRINAMLSKRKYEAEDTIIIEEDKNRNISTKKLKDSILGIQSVSFTKYFQAHLDRLEKLEKIGTFKKDKAIFEKLKTYCKNKDVKFTDIDQTFLKNFDLFLKTEYKNNTNTVHSNMTAIKKLFNSAVAEELIGMEMNPFRKYKLSKQKVFKGQLDEDDLEKLMSLKLEKATRNFDIRNMFIFSCYSGGLRISDLLLMKWEDFDGSKLNIVMHKTSEMVSIKIPDKGLSILNIYGLNDSYKNQKKYIFPFLDSNKTYSKKELFNSISAFNALINKNLKNIAIQANLKQTNISCHWARRTFACLALSKGMPLEHVSKMLGHSGSAVTLQSYAKFMQPDLDKSMEILNN
jgi:site-specific recombinase XerD